MICCFPSTNLRFSFNDITYSKNHYCDARTEKHHHYLALLKEGTCKIVANDRTIEINPGEVFYIPGWLPYQSFWESENEIRYKTFGFEFFPENRSNKYILQKIDCDNEIINLIENFDTESHFNSKAMGTFYTILGNLLPKMVCADVTNEKLIVEKAKNFIYANPDSKIWEIAKHCLISESMLYEIFKKETGMTPNTMRQKTLCQKAEMLLTTTDKSVEEISDILGFSSTSYFRKLMHKHLGSTPTEIRKNFFCNI